MEQHTWQTQRSEATAKAATIIGAEHEADADVRALTGFRSVLDMMGDALATGDSGYRPTMRVDLDPRYGHLADVYDAMAEKLELTKRAHRPVLWSVWHPTKKGAGVTP